MRGAAFSLACPLFLIASTGYGSEPAPPQAATLDLVKLFAGSPTIYTALICMSISSLALWLYSLVRLREGALMPAPFIEEVRSHLQQGKIQKALNTCGQSDALSARILSCGLAARSHGSQVMLKSMQAEGRRTTITLWQRISLLGDVVTVAPMFGLLGTVLGMFFAFYSTNQANENIEKIFDGLGIAMGTTVVGLIVAIAAMLFHTTLKYRITILMNKIENELLSLIHLMEKEPEG